MNRFVAAFIAAWLSQMPVAAQTAADPIFHVTKSKPKLNPALMRGFAAFKAGDLAAAELEYAQALKSEPSNPDALHGAAMVALRKNERERAEGIYRRAIAADPRDAVALAGLIGLHGAADAVASESRLKSMIAAQPDQPSLHFALGNIYADSGRWNDAQQAFFDAYSSSPDQPDYLFNLAVSLDHLHHGKLARGFYEKALGAADRHPAAFDQAQVAARLRELP